MPLLKEIGPVVIDPIVAQKYEEYSQENLAVFENVIVENFKSAKE